MKKVFITLLQTCMIAGLPRSPVEGPQEVGDDEAERLVGAGMAEYADIAPTDEGDDLESLPVKVLRSLAANEGRAVKSNATKAELIAAIAVGRERAALVDELSSLDKDALIERAKADEAEIGADADEAAIREAIVANQYPTAG